MLSVFCSPARYVQGPEATKALASEIQYLGYDGPTLILASNSAEKLLATTWQQSFAEKKMPYQVIAFHGECSASEITRVKEAAKKAQSQVLVGAGGGKVLDTIRAVAADLHLPVINCPTVASSDAPCSALSVVYDDDGAFQEYRIYKKNPEMVLVDTTVIAKSPQRLLVAGMGDALATLFEADTCVKHQVANMRGGLPTQASFALAKLCYETLLADGVDAKAALGNKEVNPALERIVEANTLLSGLGFESCGLAAAHAIHNGLTVLPQTHAFYHGEKVAFGALVQLVMENKSDALINELLNFSSAIGLPIQLAELGLGGIGDKEVMAIANRATEAGETIHNEPFPITPTLVAEAITEADKIGSAFIPC